MIKFFRHIRKELMETGKTAKYFKYAIGEIVLVVIGILIAVVINGKYNEAQNEKKIKSILTQIQKELLVDIADAERIFDVKMGKDSLARKIYFNTVSEEEFIKNPFRLRITSNYVSFTTQKAGYNRLMQNLENLPEEYQYILPFFNDLYVEKQNDINDYNETIKNTWVLHRNSYNKNPIYADLNLGILSREESLRYLFNDPFIKNRTMTYLNDLRNISQIANDYKADAIKIYKNIDSLLGIESNDLKLKTLPRKDSIEPFKGTYKTMSAFNIPDQKLTIKKDHIVISHLNTIRLLYWHKTNYFYEYYGDGVFVLYKNEHGQRMLSYSNDKVKHKFMHKDDIKDIQ